MATTNDSNDYYCKRGIQVDGNNQSDNTGFGLCMLNPNNSNDSCREGRGNTNIGFGLCMLSDNGDTSFGDCKDTLDTPSLGVGICMGAGRPENNCDEGLHGYNIGFGLCMTEYNNTTSMCQDLLVQDGGNLSSEFLLTLNGATKSINNERFSSTTPVKIDLALTPNYQYLHQMADLFVVARLSDLNGNNPAFYQQNGSAFNPWNGDLATLAPAVSNVELKGTITTPVFQGALSGQKNNIIKLYHGYRLKTAPVSDVKYNNNYDITFIVD